MGYETKVLTCQKCGRRFTFTADEQVFYALKGLSGDPMHCPTCRPQWPRAGRTSRGLRTIVCAGCGKEAQVLIAPDGSTRDYCPLCYRQQRRGRRE
jgi:CxxC-x17-CxxC domain-containing protein